MGSIKNTSFVIFKNIIFPISMMIFTTLFVSLSVSKLTYNSKNPFFGKDTTLVGVDYHGRSFNNSVKDCSGVWECGK